MYYAYDSMTYMTHNNVLGSVREMHMRINNCLTHIPLYPYLT